MTPKRALLIALSVLEAFRENAAFGDYQEADRDTLDWSDEDYDDMLGVLKEMLPELDG